MSSRLSMALMSAILSCIFFTPQSLFANDSFSRGLQLCKEHQYEKAFNIFTTLNDFIPDNPSIMYNLAYSLKAMGRMQEAIPWYEKVLELTPDHGHTHYGLSQACIAIGDYERGWYEFEWRLVQRNYFAQNNSLTPKQLFTGKKVLLYLEFGVGDTMFFIRYAKLLKQLGATVVVQCYHFPLKPLLSLCPYIDKIIESGQSSPNVDMKIPLLSMPLIFKTTVTTVPAETPYLCSDSTLTSFWKKKLALDQNSKIGICWHASATTYLEHNPLTKRSIPLKLFEPITQLPEISVYSLQKLYGVDQLSQLSPEMHINTFENLDEASGPFMDTAAIMQHLDLIITVDTSIAHLAGALGRPVWVLLPYAAEWRWMQNRTDSPWYPTMRLFRCPKPGDWHSVMEKISLELQELIQKKERGNA